MLSRKCEYEKVTYKCPSTNRQAHSQGFKQQGEKSRRSKTSAERRKMTLGIFQREGTPEGRGLPRHLPLLLEAARGHRSATFEATEAIAIGKN